MSYGGRTCAVFTCLLVMLLLVILPCSLVPVIVPDMLIPRVENGTLYALALDKGASTLTYNFSAVFSFCKTAVYEPDQLRVANVAVALIYGGQQLGADASLPTFELEHLETTMLPPLEAQGRQITGAVEGMARTEEEDAARGYYTIEAKLHVRTSKHRWCDSSCMLSFLAPTPLRGGPYMFDGEDCRIKCKKRASFYK